MYIVNILDAAHYKARKCHFSFVLGGGKTRINSPPLRLSLAKSYGAICICWSAPINIISCCARSCNMLHATSERTMIASAIYFRAVLQLELQLHLRHSLQLRHLPHLNPQQRGPFWGQSSIYKHAYVRVCASTYVQRVCPYVLHPRVLQ